jgi:hypothetical protein
MFPSKSYGTTPGHNHGRNVKFAADLAKVTVDGFDLVVGFDKLWGIHLLYCADSSVVARKGMWRRLTPRYRALRASKLPFLLWVGEFRSLR